MSGLQPPDPEERQPSPIPDSALARDFSDQLDGLFNLGGELSGLTQSVEDKRQVISSQNRELEELEARLKAAESKLQQAGGQGAANGTFQPRTDSGQVYSEATVSSSNGSSTAPSGTQQTKQSSTGSEFAKVQAAAESRLNESSETGSSTI